MVVDFLSTVVSHIIVTPWMSDYHCWSCRIMSSNMCLPPLHLRLHSTSPSWWTHCLWKPSNWTLIDFLGNWMITSQSSIPPMVVHMWGNLVGIDVGSHFAVVHLPECLKSHLPLSSLSCLHCVGDVIHVLFHPFSNSGYVHHQNLDHFRIICEVDPVVDVSRTIRPACWLTFFWWVASWDMGTGYEQKKSVHTSERTTWVNVVMKKKAVCT